MRSLPATFQAATCHVLCHLTAGPRRRHHHVTRALGSALGMMAMQRPAGSVDACAPNHSTVLTSLHGGQSPSQQRARQAWRPQFRVRRHRNSQRSGSQQGTVFSSRPQEQVFGTAARQAAGQGPAWHRSGHRCSPQASSLSQVLPQVGVGSSHAKSPYSACSVTLSV